MIRKTLVSLALSLGLLGACSPANMNQACGRFCGQLDDDLTDLTKKQALNCAAKPWGAALDSKARDLCKKTARTEAEQKSLRTSLEGLKKKELKNGEFTVSWAKCNCEQEK